MIQHMGREPTMKIFRYFKRLSHNQPGTGRVVTIRDWTGLRRLVIKSFVMRKGSEVRMYEPKVSCLPGHSAVSDPLSDAITAAQELRDVTKCAIANDYREMTRVNCRESFGRAVGRGLSYLNLFFAPVAFMTAITVASHAGQAGAALALSTLMFPAWMGPAMYFDRLDNRERKPSFQLMLCNKKLSLAAEHIPNPSATVLVENFRKAANHAFALGEIAAVQKEIVHSRAEGKHTGKLFKKGLKLIKNTASGLGWDESRRAALTAAFNAGMLPPPHKYAHSVDDSYQQFLANLSETGFSPTIPATRICA